MSEVPLYPVLTRISRGVCRGYSKAHSVKLVPAGPNAADTDSPKVCADTRIPLC